MTATATKPARGARIETSFGLRLLVLTAGAGPGAVQTRFHLEEHLGHAGRRFTLRKVAADGGDGSGYGVSLAGAGSCSCPWGRHGRGKPCRHVAALRALVAAGRV